MALDSATKQEAMKRHINEVVEMKKRELESVYDKKKEQFCTKNFSSRKKHIRNALEGILRRARELQDEFKKTAKQVGYPSHCDSGIEVTPIRDNAIETAIDNEFEETMKSRKEELEDLLEQARLDAIEKVLFADEEKLHKLVTQLKTIRVDFA